MALPLAGKNTTLRGWMSSTSSETMGMRSVCRYCVTKAVLRSPTFMVVKLCITCPPPKILACRDSRRAPSLSISLISSSMA
jgi:hypothetical protein